MIRRGRSSPPSFQRRNSNYIKTGEGSNMDDSESRLHASSAPVAFNPQQPSDADAPLSRAARTLLPSQSQASVTGEFANEFIEHWLSRVDDASLTHASDEQLTYSESPTRNEFRPINSNSVVPARRQSAPVALAKSPVVVRTPSINVGDSVLALLQIQRDDANLAHEPQTAQSVTSSSQTQTVLPATLTAGCRAQQRFKRRSSTTDVKSATTDKRARFVRTGQIGMGPEAALGHSNRAATAQPEEIQRQVPSTTVDMVRALGAKAGGNYEGSSTSSASDPIPTCPVPSPGVAPMSTTNTVTNPATESNTVRANNGPVAVNYSQLIPKILRSFPAKSYTLPLSEIYGHVEAWKRLHGITTRLVKQSIRASLNRMQVTPSNKTPIVQHIKMLGARTGHWRLLRPQDWQPLTTISSGSTQAAAAEVAVLYNDTAGAASPSQANSAVNATHNAQLIAAEALALLKGVERRENVQDNLQVSASTTTSGAASARDLIQRAAAGNKNSALFGPTTVQGNPTLSKNTVCYPSPSSSTPESSKSATQSHESSESSSEILSQAADERPPHGMTILEILADVPAPSPLRARGETSPNPSRP